jgi:UDP-glucose 4-epimerase
VRSQRILITGLSSTTGGRLAQALEQRPEVEAIVGIDTEDPRHELQRTEFVRVAADQVLLARIIRAAAIDTVIATRLVAMAELLGACDGAPVRRIVVKSSAHYYGCGHDDDPAFFSEDLPPAHPPRTSIERDVVEAESLLSRFADAHPEVTVTSMRCADSIGGESSAAQLALFNLPVVPAILGFDPRWQFVHDDDVIGALAHAARHDLTGAYNIAADGVLVLSEIASLLGKRLVPVLPPWGTVFAGAQLRRLGVPIRVETLRQLRFGRGLDNRRLKASGFAFHYTTREAVLKLRAQQRLRPLLRSGGESYRYEREVEEFLRWSPSVQSAARRSEQPSSNGPSVPGYDDLGEGELIELISSLEMDALKRLRSYESAHGRRSAVLAALDQNLARKEASEPAEPG